MACHVVAPDAVGSMVQGIYKGAPSLAEGRRLATRLLWMVWSGKAERATERDTEVETVDPVCSLDNVLAQIKLAAGFEGDVGVTRAKDWLRKSGERGHVAASRLGKLSSMRNRKCHPLGQQLLAEVQMIAEATKAGVTEVDSTKEDEQSCDTLDTGSGGESERLDDESVKLGVLVSEVAPDLDAQPAPVIKQVEMPLTQTIEKVVEVPYGTQSLFSVQPETLRQVCPAENIAVDAPSPTQPALSPAQLAADAHVAFPTQEQNARYDVHFALLREKKEGEG